MSGIRLPPLSKAHRANEESENRYAYLLEVSTWRFQPTRPNYLLLRPHFLRVSERGYFSLLEIHCIMSESVGCRCAYSQKVPAPAFKQNVVNIAYGVAIIRRGADKEFRANPPSQTNQINECQIEYPGAYSLSAPTRGFHTIWRICIIRRRFCRHWFRSRAIPITRKHTR